MMTLALLALLVTTPDGLPPKANTGLPPKPQVAPAPALQPQRPAADHGPNVDKPAAGASIRVAETHEAVVTAQAEPARRLEPAPIAPGACGDERCICVAGCDGVNCVGGCNLAKKAKADDRQWFALGAPYQGFQGFGRIDPATGLVTVEWSCRTGSTDVRRGLPPLQPAIPAPITVLGGSTLGRYWPPVTYDETQAGGCANGQCTAPQYTRRPGFYVGPFGR